MSSTMCLEMRTLCIDFVAAFKVTAVYSTSLLLIVEGVWALCQCRHWVGVMWLLWDLWCGWLMVMDMLRWSCTLMILELPDNIKTHPIHVQLCILHHHCEISIDLRLKACINVKWKSGACQWANSEWCNLKQILWQSAWPPPLPHPPLIYCL